eukprot:XP_011680799.1 PREDICTED: uncharacterized protein LOC100891641 [Strongylocentrotus purpuratus]
MLLDIKAALLSLDERAGFVGDSTSAAYHLPSNYGGDRKTRLPLKEIGSDGLLKLWTIKTNECVATLDEHSDKLWSVTVDRSEQKVVTAGADSNILIWEDVTQIEYEEKAEKEEDQILKKQQLSNLMHSKKFTKALRLAITLDQPFKALGIIRTILEEPDGEAQLAITITKLRPDQIESVLRFAQTWNMNSKHCHVAQCVLGIIFRSQDPDDLAKFPGVKDILEGLMPYTDRHFQRLSRMLQQAMFVQYTWQVMRRASGLQELTGELEATTSDGTMGMEDFFLDKIGDITQENDDDDSSDDQDGGDKDEEEEVVCKDVEEESSRIVKRKSKHEWSNSKSCETHVTRDSDDDNGEEVEELERFPSLKRTGEIKKVASQDKNAVQDCDEEKENQSRPSRKSGKKEEKSRTSSVKKTLRKDRDGNDDEKKEEPPSPVKQETLQVSKEKASATPGRGSKRKSTLKPVEGAGISPKKTTPSPYNKRLRKQSRK